MANVLQKTAEEYKPRGRLDPAAFREHIALATYAPPQDLAPFVEHFWTVSWDDLEGAYHSEDVMHRPYVDIFISREQIGVQGTFRNKRTYEAKGSGKIVGIRFLPGAFYVLWAGDMERLQDEMLDLDVIFPGVRTQLTKDMLEEPDEVIVSRLSEFIRERNPQPNTNIALIGSIITLIETGEAAAISDIAKSVHKSERWLQQLFQDYVGIGLKWLLQRRRLLDAAEVIRDSATMPNWAAIAYDLGYSSQQHFNSDFKKVMEKTPLQYYRQTNRRVQVN